MIQFALVTLTLLLRALAADKALASVATHEGILFGEAEKVEETTIWKRMKLSSDQEARRLLWLLQDWRQKPPEESERLIGDVYDLPEMLGLAERRPHWQAPPSRISVTVEQLPALPLPWRASPLISPAYRETERQEN